CFGIAGLLEFLVPSRINAIQFLSADPDEFGELCEFGLFAPRREFRFLGRSQNLLQVLPLTENHLSAAVDSFGRKFLPNVFAWHFRLSIPSRQFSVFGSRYP